MMDENDDGARVGLWVVIGIITLLLFGLIGGLGIRAQHAKKPAAAPAAAAHASALVEEALVDAPLSGEVVAKLFFESGKADAPADAAATLAAAVKALADAHGKKLVLAGFHDLTGDPAQNAELAKQRAKAVRAELVKLGVDATKVQLRKPEQTAQGGPADEARRVEVRLVD
jgi:outer membrane protein OmpA-like peptidoglycan-associated protein